MAPEIAQDLPWHCDNSLPKVVEMASLFCLTVVKADAHPCGLGPEEVFVLEMLNRLLPLPARSLFSPASFFPLDFVREQELSHPFL